MTAQPVLIDPFVADVMTAMMTSTHAATERCIESLQATIADQDATLAAIRSGVCDLLAGPWMPTPDRIEAALWPSQKAIDAHRKEAS